jgi:Putative Flp pilus-assembly TadE/G-like
VHRLRRAARCARRRVGSEHGAVAAIVAALLSGGVLIGLGAVVIDVGQLYVEREELQTGADAASWKIALNCVAATSACTAGTQTPVAVAYARRNAKDGQADAQVCLNGVACPSWSTAVTCPPLGTPAAGRSVGNYVEVRTATRTSSGATLLPPTFAGALAGGGYRGKQVGACARVSWGPPVVDKVFAMGFSYCDWKRMTANGTVAYGPAGTLVGSTGLLPMLGLPTALAGDVSAVPQVLPLSVAGLPVPSCSLLEPTVPRGYAWLGNPDLSGPDSSCMIDAAVGDSPRSFVLSGLLVGTWCAQQMQTLRATGQPVMVPIFDAIQPALLTLAPAYHIIGFAAFVVTGYAGLLGIGAPSALGPLGTVAAVLCGTTSSCVYGYFTRALVPTAGPVFGTGINLGATVIGRTG